MSTSLSTSPDLPVPPPTRTEVLGMLRLLLVGSATWAALLCVYFTLGQWSFNHMVPALAWGVVGTFPVLLTARWMSGQHHALSPQCRKFVIISGAIPFNLIAFLGHAKAMGNLKDWSYNPEVGYPLPGRVDVPARARHEALTLTLERFAAGPPSNTCCR